MITVLAAIDETPAARRVLQAAKVMAATIDAAVRAVHVQENDARAPWRAAEELGIPIEVRGGDPTEGVLAAAGDPDIAVVVIGAGSRQGGRPVGHVAFATVTALACPVLVVAHDARLPEDGRFRRVLAPLEGNRSSTDAVVPTLGTLTDRGCSVIAVHVFHPPTVPRFWDQAGHADETWRSEFLGRWCSEPSAELHLRAGEVPGAILDVARDQDVDLIALGWSRRLNHNRAAVVRAVLERSPVPILLMPVGPTDSSGRG